MDSNMNINHIKNITSQISSLAKEINFTIITLKIELAKCENLKYDISDLELIAKVLDNNLNLIDAEIRLNNVKELFRLLLVLKNGLYQDRLASLNLQIVAMKMNSTEGKVLSAISEHLAYIMKQIEEIILGEEAKNKGGFTDIFNTKNKQKVLIKN